MKFCKREFEDINNKNNMEVNKIQILENFALTSVIIPYYGASHECFLLLSWFSTKSRRKLNSYYCEFTKIMRKYWATYHYADCGLGKFPPNDLFKFAFYNNIQMQLFCIQSLILIKFWLFKLCYFRFSMKI